MIMEKLGQNHVTFPEESFHAFGCNYLLPDAFTHVHFHCHRNYLDTASLLHSLLGMSKGKNSRFTSSLESSAAHLNLIWTIKSFDSAETRVWGKGGNVWFKEGFRVEWRGGFVGNCARTSFLVRILYFLILTEPRNTTKVFLETSKIFGRPFYKHFASFAFLSRASDRCPRKGMNFTKITWIPRDCHWTFISNSVNLCGLTRASDLSHFSFKQKEQSGRPN